MSLKFLELAEAREYQLQDKIILKTFVNCAFGFQTESDKALRSPTVQCSLVCEIVRDILKFLELDIQCFLVAVADEFGRIEETFLTDGAF